VLRHDRIVLRPIRRRDAPAWREIRARNADWLRPWEATLPPRSPAAASSFAAMVRDLRRQAHRGYGMPFVITFDDQLVGQVTVGAIARGSARSAQLGYWIDSRYAGRGLMPVAVALVIDHCLGVAGLHRVEIAIRPENAASLRVVAKLGLRREGQAPRYLHINGAWRDHVIFALTVEEVPQGALTRLLES